MDDLQEGLQLLNRYKLHLAALGCAVFLFSVVVRSCGENETKRPHNTVQNHKRQTGSPDDPSLTRVYHLNKKMGVLNHFYIRRKGKKRYALKLREYNLKLYELPEKIVKEVLGYIPAAHNNTTNHSN